MRGVSGVRGRNSHWCSIPPFSDSVPSACCANLEWEWVRERNGWNDDDDAERLEEDAVFMGGGTCFCFGGERVLAGLMRLDICFILLMEEGLMLLSSLPSLSSSITQSIPFVAFPDGEPKREETRSSIPEEEVLGRLEVCALFSIGGGYFFPLFTRRTFDWVCCK